MAKKQPEAPPAKQTQTTTTKGSRNKKDTTNTEATAPVGTKKSAFTKIEPKKAAP